MNKMLELKEPIDAEIYSYLNALQPQSFMLYAGAGSGKTRTLINILEALQKNRGASLLLSGQRIAIVTYTNAACDEIKARLKNDPVFHVSTIHSFSWEIIKFFTSDIKSWLETKLTEDIQKLNLDISKAKNITGVTAQKNIRKRDNKILRLDTIKTVNKFSYTPNSVSDDVGALNHSEVVAIAAFFLKNMPLMENIFINHYPIFLIDETQDTNEDLLDSIISVQQNHPEKFCVGLFGDTMQRIFGGGKTNLKESLPKSWVAPEKKVNHRCPVRIINLINKIRSLDDPHQQEPAEDSKIGTAALFIIDAEKNLPKAACEEIIRKKMAEITNDNEWAERKKVKTLTLEHHMAAARGGFDGFLTPFLAIEHLKENVLKSEGRDINFLLSVLLPLVEFIKSGDDFGVASIFRKYSPLLAAPHLRNVTDPIGEIRHARDSVEVIAQKLVKSPNCQIISLLRTIDENNLFSLPSTFLPHLVDVESLAEDADEFKNGDDDQDEDFNAWSCALKSPIDQLAKYAAYRSDNSDFGTHQGVKGLQYDRVMVILDDQEARGFLFSYDKLLGATPPTEIDIKKEKEGKDTPAKRSRRLFYVTCSRSKKSLAVVAYTKNPDAVKKYVIDSEWFRSDEIIEILDDSTPPLANDLKQKPQKRIPLESIEFTESINGINGYANGWFFLVNASFRPALDVIYTKYWTEGVPPVYKFRANDGLESRSGAWYVQVQKSFQNYQDASILLQVRLYERNTENPALCWKLKEIFTLTQEEFVQLLKTGKCSSVSLLQ